MTNVIVAFPKPEDAKSIKNILVKHGFRMVAACTSGAQLLQCADSLNTGIIVSGWYFADMVFTQIYECLPTGFEMLLIASPTSVSDQVPPSVLYLALPLKVHELLSAVESLVEQRMMKRRKLRETPKVRNQKEQETLNQVKQILMERNHMTEAQAHRYIQKCSMDTGTSLVETAQMILRLAHSFDSEERKER